MRLLLDEMLDAEIAVQLRQRGHDVVAVQEHPTLWGTPDEELLIDVAYQDDRVLVTDNVHDFLPLHAALMASGDHHAGLLLAAANTLPRTKRALGLWITTLDTYLRTLPDGASLTDSYEWLYATMA